MLYELYTLIAGEMGVQNLYYVLGITFMLGYLFKLVWNKYLMHKDDK